MLPSIKISSEFQFQEKFKGSNAGAESRYREALTASVTAEAPYLARLDDPSSKPAVQFAWFVTANPQC
jgi:hypothetical protein